MKSILFPILLFLGVFAYHPVQAEENLFESSVEQDPNEDINDKPWRLKKDKKKEKSKKKSASANKQFKRMARDLLGQPHWSDRFMGLLQDDLPKIAIHPFQNKDIPISLEEAGFYVDGLTRALIREAGDRYAIVGRKEIGAVVEDINNMGTRSESLNPLGDLFDRAQSDLLAVGNITLAGEKLVIAFKLVETETGRIVSSTQKPFKRLQKDQEKILKGLSVEGAVQAAVEHLMRDVYEVRKILVQGLPYQTTGVHSDFSRYFMGLISDHLRTYASKGARNLQSLDVTEFVVEEEVFRGLALKENNVETATLRGTGRPEKPENDFLLKGSYWVFDEYVEIRLNLIGRSQSGYAWRGKILKSEIPASFELVPPPAPVEETAYRTLGPIDLYLSSNKGDNPDYKIGETMNLVLKVQENAYVYCYYLQADGAVLRILPNRFLTDSKMPGGFVQHIPSTAMPFAFEIAPPAGVEAVKCFALDRDVTSDLELHFDQGDFNSLSVSTEAELIKIYRDLPNAALSEATLVITTHQ